MTELQQRVLALRNAVEGARQRVKFAIYYAEDDVNPRDWEIAEEWQNVVLARERAGEEWVVLRVRVFARPKPPAAPDPQLELPLGGA